MILTVANTVGACFMVFWSFSGCGYQADKNGWLSLMWLAIGIAWLSILISVVTA